MFSNRTVKMQNRCQVKLIEYTLRQFECFNFPTILTLYSRMLRCFEAF